jgi:hypothetical protein
MEIKNMNLPILEGEDMWASEAIDETSYFLNRLLRLVESSIESKLNFSEASGVQSELIACINNPKESYHIKTWLDFCRSLEQTALESEAREVIVEMKKFVMKHLPMTTRDLF